MCFLRILVIVTRIMTTRVSFKMLVVLTAESLAL
jgi:hypothetical protein